MWDPPDCSCHFRVVVFVVDDTYWDDGNRTTRRQHNFGSLAEVFAFTQALVKKGSYTTKSGQTGETFTKYVDDDSYRVYQWLDKTPAGNPKKKPVWKEIESADLITLLGSIAAD